MRVTLIGCTILHTLHYEKQTTNDHFVQWIFFKGKKSQIPSFVVELYVTDTGDAILVDVGHEKYSVQAHALRFYCIPILFQNSKNDFSTIM